MVADDTQPYRFITHTSEVGHTVVIGSIGSGKSVHAELANQWAAEHSSGSIWIARANGVEGE